MPSFIHSFIHMYQIKTFICLFLVISQRPLKGKAAQSVCSPHFLCPFLVLDFMCSSRAPFPRLESSVESSAKQQGFYFLTCVRCLTIYHVSSSPPNSRIMPVHLSRFTYMPLHLSRGIAACLPPLLARPAVWAACGRDAGAVAAACVPLYYVQCFSTCFTCQFKLSALFGC